MSFDIDGMMQNIDLGDEHEGDDDKTREVNSPSPDSAGPVPRYSSGDLDKEEDPKLKHLKMLKKNLGESINKMGTQGPFKKVLSKLGRKIE